MSRQEKRTRVRGLPPRVQLREADNLSGSYPVNDRFSTDGRRGQDEIAFNDRKTINYGRSESIFYYGIGLPNSSYYLSLSGARDMYVSTSLSGPGLASKGVVDASYIVRAPEHTQLLSPFVEDRLHEADGKSAMNVFFSTGSAVLDVGEGFSSPLWSKQKIEIDISVAHPTTLNLKKAAVFDNNAGGTSYPMAYYNFDTQTWDPIGLGYEINAFTNTDNTAEHITIGFGNGLLPPGNSSVKVRSSGYCISDLGFPFHPKFHATSSQTLRMSNYISEPFVLEKAVITISGAWAIGAINTSAYNNAPRRTVTSSINTCFILNQRRNQNFTAYKKMGNAGTPTYWVTLTASVPSIRNLNWNSTSSTRVDTIRDLVGFSQIFSFAKDSYDKLVYDSSTAVSSSPNTLVQLTPNDVLLVNASDSSYTGADWDGLITMSMSMCTPAAGGQTYGLEAGSRFVSGAFMTSLLKYDTIADYDEISLGQEGYRTGLGIHSPSTRGLTGDYYRNPAIKRVTLSGPLLDVVVEVTQDKHKINPYILLPSDELILGWQIPISANPAQYVTAGSDESTFTFLPGTFKMTLYGSYIRENREYNDTTNQLLTSNAIHEVIE